MLSTSRLNLVWANKPGCSTAVAEVWIGRDYLWFTLFIDDNDGRLKFEILPPLGEMATHVIDFTEVESLLDTAKRDLMAMLMPPE